MKALLIKPETLQKIKSSSVDASDGEAAYIFDLEDGTRIEFIIKKDEKFGTIIKGRIRAIDDWNWVSNPSEVFCFFRKKGSGVSKYDLFKKK